MWRVTLKNIRVKNAGTDGIAVIDLNTGNRGTVNFDGVKVSGSKGKAFSLGGAAPSLVNKVGNANEGW